ncbi:tyrosine-protein phosphatase [Rhodobacteraceae bacterium NNCM2]|nr:tyrosine-protein phosphatase [Coraliihabitans acroporae]
MNGPTKSVPAADAREKRLNRWQRPLVTWWDRVCAWTNSLLVDHAFIRAVYLNKHKISSRAWRAAQPLPHQLREFARQGVKTVVSLRGGQTFGSLPLEKETCAETGMTFVNFVMRSRSLPSVEDLHAAQALFDEIEYPVLFHCKSGADRAGFMSTLFLVLAEGKSVAEARGQLSLRYGHIKEGKTGVLDAFWDTYQQDTGGKVPLMEWVDTTYDRDKVQNAFEPTNWGSIVTDRLLSRE